MGRFLIFFAPLLLVLVFTSSLAQFEVQEQAIEEKNDTIKQVTSYITQLFAFTEFFKIKGAAGPQFFSVEFMAAFILIYFIVGNASGYVSAGFANSSVARVFVTMILIGLIWNFLGGMKWERLLILLVPPMIVYYVIHESLTNFAMVGRGTSKIIALAAAAISFFFYGPRFVSYMNGQYSYGLLDTLAGAGGFFFAVVIFGFLASKFMMTMSAPLNKADAIKIRENFYRQVEELPETSDDQRKKKARLLDVIQKLQLLGGGR